MRQLARLSCLCAFLFAVLLCRSASFAAGPPPAAYTVALIQVSFTDVPDSSHAYDLGALATAGDEIARFYSSISFGRMAMRTKVGRVTLSRDRAYYFGHCENDTNPPVTDRCEEYLRDVVTAMRASDRNFFDGVDAINIVTPGNIGNGQFSWNPVDPGLGRNVGRGYLKEFSLMPADSTPWPSRIPWHGWAHEIGHQIQYAANLDMSCGGTAWCGHPSGYSSGYDLMDSCYPCDENSYGLAGPPIIGNDKGSFRGWLDTSRIATVAVPGPGATTGGTFVLPPLSQTLGAPATQAIYIPISRGQYYVVNTRTRNGADARSRPGIWDEGVQISYVVESNSVPMTPCAPAPATHSCVQNPPAPPGVTCVGPSGAAPTHTGAANQCAWPYPLWHTGQTFTDDANNLRIDVLPAVGGTAGNPSERGWTVTVARGVPPGRPDLYLIPWLTPPHNQYETVDIWVDSSCNAYESDGGPLRYGHNDDPERTVSRSGDDPCLNHENRVYARIHNGGTAASAATTAHFSVTDPLGMGVTGHWVAIGNASVPSIAPGGTATVFVNWTPAITLTPEQIAAGHFAFHSCIDVKLDAVPGELIVSNNEAQENIDIFEARTDPPGGAGGDTAADPDRGMMAGGFEPMSHEMMLRNAFTQGRSLTHVEADADPHRMFQLIAQSKLPPGWTYVIGDGANHVFLGPDELRRIPVRIVPTEAAVGRIYELKASASTYRWMYNTAVPPSDPHYRHMGVGEVGGVTLAAHTVYRTKLTLARTDANPALIDVAGELRAKHPNAVIAIDYTDPRGRVATRLVRTDEASRYRDSFRPGVAGTYQVRALWQGDMDHSSAVADLLTVQVKGGAPEQQTPAPVAALSFKSVTVTPAAIDCAEKQPSVVVRAALSSPAAASVVAQYRYGVNGKTTAVNLTLTPNGDYAGEIPVQAPSAKGLTALGLPDALFVAVTAKDQSGQTVAAPPRMVPIKACAK